MNVLFLYTELAEYFVKCCEELSKKTNVHIIRWPVNKEAPFVFSFPDKVNVYDKAGYSYPELEKLIKQINPDVIICSGWIDKDYLRLTKPYHKKIPTVLTCDTHWAGSLKQYIALALSRFFILNTFSHAWVPGNAQFLYVKKMGFKQNKIKKGFYCCDLEKYNGIYSLQAAQKKNNFPKRFLYVGRYYKFKGILDLWEAFIQIQDEQPNDWELWCLGTGDIEPRQHEKIKHFGFVQPKDIAEITQNCGVFVLPSHFEPWGVVVQEYAAAGFVLLTSSSVGANEAFVHENQNGFSFEAKNVAGLKKVLKKIISLDTGTIQSMSAASHQIAQTINLSTWSQTLIEIYNDFKSN